MLQAFPYANHGRWVVDCPRCPNAFLESDIHGKHTCGNCGAEFKVVALKPHVKAGIELVLNRRPEAGNRNWFQHETLDDLHAENLANGVGA